MTFVERKENRKEEGGERENIACREERVRLRIVRGWPYCPDMIITLIPSIWEWGESRNRRKPSAST